ncbi:MAG: ParB N-terminal domain-containing protein [Syntrophaceae bacterium]|nr:ParB N-terminal domain-containing protein [Syntrophaceae bacterium]
MMMNPAYEKGKLYDLPIGDLNPDPNQPRKSMDPQALEDLAASITQHGVLTPILFQELGGHDAASCPPNSVQVPGTLILVAGERRLRAAQLAGLTGGKTGATPYFPAGK